MPFKATCPACHKQFRVPHDKKVWSCKACGGDLELAEEAREREACGECGAALEAGAHFCAECGATMGGGEQHVAKREGREQRRVKVALHGALKPVRVLKGYVKFLIVLRAIGLFFVIAGLIEGLDGITMLSLAVAVLELALLVTVFKQLTRRPFPAALALAGVRTLYLFLLFMGSELEVTETLVGLIPAILFTALFWHIAYRAARFTRLAKQNPDLLLSKALDDRDFSDAKRKRMRQQQFGTVKLVGGLFLAVILGSLGLLYAPQIPKIWRNLTKQPAAVVVVDVPPDEMVAGFRRAWNAKDIEALAGFGRGGKQAKWERSFGRLDKRYGWGGDWPQVTEFAIDQDDRRARVELDTEAGILGFSVTYLADEGWRLTSISYENVKTWKQ